MDVVPEQITAATGHAAAGCLDIGKAECRRVAPDQRGHGMHIEPIKPEAGGSGRSKLLQAIVSVAVERQ